MIMLTAEPLERPTASGVPIGDHITIDHWEIRPLKPGILDVVIYWTATCTPGADYSTFVHVSDQPAISRSEDLVAQSDYSAPVYGWYPASRWVINEVIREDHVLQFSPDRSPKAINIGMYWQNSIGAFHILGQVILQQQGDVWTTALSD